MSYYKYRDRESQWCWRLKAANGRIVADSGEGYLHEGDCDAAISLVKGSNSCPVYRE